MVLRFEKQLKVPLPEPFWYEGKANFTEAYESSVCQVSTILSEKAQGSPSVQINPPLWSIENNWYTLREDIHIDPIQYVRLRIDGYYVSLPEV
tara:strand:+ start:643 stop:921 length:279 start_codon:yes stop_codon:yes gene_type:complete